MAALLFVCWGLIQEPAPIEALIRQLNSESVEERDRASAGLVRRGGAVLSELEKAESASESAEVRGRLQDVIHRILIAEVQELVDSVASGSWGSPAGIPTRPPLRDEVKIGVGRELHDQPARKAAFERLVWKRPPGAVSDLRNAEEGIAALKKEGAAWCLASGLYHASYQVQLRCAEALADLKAVKTVPALLDVAAALAIPVEGSKSATVHGIRQAGTARAIDRLLGTSAAWGEGQNEVALRKALEVWREAYEMGLKRKSP